MENDAWNEMIKDIHSGKRVEVDQEITDYFLEVLPPIYMYKDVVLDGKAIHAFFGFAEGAEYVVAFWHEYNHAEDDFHYYAQQTKQMNPYA